MCDLAQAKRNIARNIERTVLASADEGCCHCLQISCFHALVIAIGLIYSFHIFALSHNGFLPTVVICNI